MDCIGQHPWSLRSIAKYKRVPLLNRVFASMFQWNRRLRTAVRLIPLQRAASTEVDNDSVTVNKVEKKEKDEAHHRERQKAENPAGPNEKWYPSMQQVLPAPATSCEKPLLPLLISFSGGAGRFPFAYGIGQIIVSLAQERYSERSLSFAGVSSGAIIALVLALNLTQEEVDSTNLYNWKMLSKPYVTEWSHTFLLMRRYIFRILRLRSDWHARLKGGRFLVGIAEMLPNYKFAPRVAEKFDTEADVVEAIMCSMHLFAAGRWALRRHGKRGPWVADGGFAMNFVYIPERFHVVPVTYTMAFEDGVKVSGLSLEDALPYYNAEKWNRLVLAGAVHARAHGRLYAAIMDGRADALILHWFEPSWDSYANHTKELKKVVSKATGLAWKWVQNNLFQKSIFLLSHAGQISRYTPRRHSNVRGIIANGGASVIISSCRSKDNTKKKKNS
jgi:hypothetical protein